ncbi:MAG TPA: alpha amylase C-terminal domain-containing protein, partial [Casimicrobiaceae bacterium]|nr:alpha amylase C-terminal domain-containing protein [Casimicrobiaceae bacterium]
EWIDTRDAEFSVIAFLRKGLADAGPVLVVCNFTPVPRNNYMVGVPQAGYWREILNGDATVYGGSGLGNFGGVHSAPVPAHGRFHSLALTLPPLATTYFRLGA